MKLDKLQKHYDKLEDLERFRAVLAAEVRGDRKELKALYKTAPQETYRMTALPFCKMSDALLMIMLIAATDILGWGTLLAWVHAAALGDLAEDRWDRWDHCVEFSQQIMAVWEAIPIFTQEVLGVSADVVLSQYLPTRPKIDFALEIARGVLEVEERTMQVIIKRETPKEKQSALLATREANLTPQREEAAREYAGLMREIWEQCIK